MRILIVASYNKKRFVPFVKEQAEALRQIGCEVDFFGVCGHGIGGYLRNRRALLVKIKSFGPDVVHAHYGLSGLLANLQRSVPVITTYHGSDINLPQVRPFSRLAMRLSTWNIFVSARSWQLAGCAGKRKASLLPCGVDMSNFTSRSYEQAREALGWPLAEKKILFAGAFDNEVKNAPLAQEAMRHVFAASLVELKGYSRLDIANLFYAADALLLTSFTEGSPQVVKEAMACGCPIVSVDVGDVAERLQQVSHCTIVPRSPLAIAKELNAILENPCRTNGREILLRMGLDNTSIALKLMELYTHITKNHDSHPL